MSQKTDKPKTLPVLLAESQRRKAAKSNAPKFLAQAFPAQRAFIEDPAKLKAALCTRRAGKSLGAGLYLLKEAWENPGSVCLYVALTRQSAKEILWQPVLKKLDQKLNLQCTFNESELTCTLPNGSIIYLKGADADASEAEKFLGKAYRLVVIDEAASFRQDLSRMVYGILKPAMADQDGSIVLIGTPGNIKKGLFFRVTSNQLTPEDARWSVHRWTTADNPHMRLAFTRELAEIDRERPLYKLTPQFKQHYLGLWETDDSQRAYHFDVSLNTYTTLPEATYRLTLGVDLGHSPDPSAFVLTGYSEHDPTLYILESWSKTKMDVTDVANAIHGFQKRHKIDQVVIDGANKQAVAELANRHGLALVSADKRGKAEFMGMLDADLIQGRVKIQESCKELIEEIENLVWDQRALDRTGKRQEHPGCKNHCADSLLYSWRHSFAYLATPAPSTPKPGSDEWQRQEEEKMFEAAVERIRPRSLFEPDPNDFPSLNEPFPDF